MYIEEQKMKLYWNFVKEVYDYDIFLESKTALQVVNFSSNVW